MANQSLSSPSLDPSSVEPAALQAAVDQFASGAIVGLEGRGQDVVVVGVDIIPGIVVRQPDNSLEAAAKIYLEIHEKSRRTTSTVHGTVRFHVAPNGSVTIDGIVAAKRAA